MSADHSRSCPSVCCIADTVPGGESFSLTAISKFLEVSPFSLFCKRLVCHMEG